MYLFLRNPINLAADDVRILKNKLSLLSNYINIYFLQKLFKSNRGTATLWKSSFRSNSLWLPSGRFYAAIPKESYQIIRVFFKGMLKRRRNDYKSISFSKVYSQAILENKHYDGHFLNLIVCGCFLEGFMQLLQRKRII